MSLSTTRAALLSPTANSKELRARRSLCQTMLHVFTVVIPWPALAESWRADLETIERQSAQGTP